MAKKKSKGKGKRYDRPTPARASKAKNKKAPKFVGAAARRAAAKGDTTKPRTPRSETLPGMEQVRDRSLDRLCEGIGDVRETMNEARGEEAGLISSALKRMQEKN